MNVSIRGPITPFRSSDHLQQMRDDGHRVIRACPTCLGRGYLPKAGGSAGRPRVCHDCVRTGYQTLVWISDRREDAMRKEACRIAKDVLTQ